MRCIHKIKKNITEHKRTLSETRSTNIVVLVLFELLVPTMKLLFMSSDTRAPIEDVTIYIIALIANNYLNIGMIIKCSNKINYVV